MVEFPKTERHFQPCQIVCLEDKTARLYAEVIQTIRDRQMCWVRPLLLADFINSTETDKIYDLREIADLVWPEHLFRPALDTEVIPLVVRLNEPDFAAADPAIARQQLHAFLHRVWQSVERRSES